MMKNLLTHHVVLEMIDKGLEVTIKKGAVVVDGFYKSGTVELVINDENELIAKSRYEQSNTIYSFNDLVYLNHEWWERSKNRSDHWASPDKQWGEFMVELGLVKKRVETTVYYD